VEVYFKDLAVRNRNRTQGGDHAHISGWIGPVNFILYDITIQPVTEVLFLCYGQIRRAFLLDIRYILLAILWYCSCSCCHCSFFRCCRPCDGSGG